jgi:hypothetical protein
MNNTDVSNLVALRGFFTTQMYLQGQSLREIEFRLGFDAGRLSLGAWFAAATQLPGPDDFEFAGYSQVAGHHTAKVYGNINSPSNDSERQAILARKKSVIARWELYGSERLIKVVPMIGHSLNMIDNYQYPPGSGIPQWKITKPVLCRGICFVKEYPNGKFIPDQGYKEVKYK